MATSLTKSREICLFHSKPQHSFQEPRRHQTFQSFDIPFFRQIRLDFTLWKDVVPNYNLNFQATLLTLALVPWLQSTWLYHRLCQFRQLPPPPHRVRRLRPRLQRLPHPLSAIISSPPTPWEKSLMDSPDHLHWHFLRYTGIRYRVWALPEIDFDAGMCNTCLLWQA